MTRIVMVGQGGQLSTEIARHQADLIILGRDKADLNDPAGSAAALRTVIAGAEAVINTAAYTAVDRAEGEADIAARINAESPGALARMAAKAGVPFLHVSTDYVFNGSGDAPFAPDDPTGPLSVYGATKLAGEQAVRAAGGPHVILRTSWVFSAHGANFVKTMLRLGAERASVNVVADQSGGPTPAADIARTLITIAMAFAGGRGRSGTYHFSGAPDVTWADFARAIFAQAGLPTQVTDIPTRAFPTPARRPANSRLNCSTLAADYGIARPDWRVGLADVLAELRT
jgi:dTDP-4-dehydrorhamnose reductase